MKTGRSNPQCGRRGMAVVLVLIILGLLAFLASSNSRTLAILKQELRRIEARQLYRPAPATNPPPAQVMPP